MREISELRKSLGMRLDQDPGLPAGPQKKMNMDIQVEQDNSGTIKSVKPVGILILSCLFCTSMLNELI